MSLKRLAFLGHRWLGVLLSLFFVVWFFSGMVMLYVGYPSTEHDRRIAGQPPLLAAHCCDAALPAITPDERARLRMLDGRLWIGRDGQWRDAATGEAMASQDAEAVRAMLARRSDVDAGAIHGLQRIDEDQWTVSGRYDQHRPLYRVALESGRWLHVSGTTGELLLDTTRAERAWNWVGAVSHWLYFTALRRHPGAWSELVIWLSVAGCAMALAGLWGGLKQWRWRRRKRGKSPIPYRGATFWHHAGGLVFGGLIFSFILSGLFSMNPWGLFDLHGVSAQERAALAGDAPPLTPACLADGLRGALLRADGFQPREVEAFAFGGRWWLRLRDGRDVRLAAIAGGPLRETLPRAEVAAAADRLALTAPERDRAWLGQADRHYYSSRGERDFPVLRLRLDDAERRWFYLDPGSGRIALKADRARRAYRWWFNGLHSLDFPWLIHNRPLWDGVLIVVSLGGLLVAATGVLVGWRRLRTALLRPRQRA